MIKNERQYIILRNRANTIKKTYEQLAEKERESDDLSQKTVILDLRKQLDDLYKQLDDFDILRYRECSMLEVSSIKELGLILIKARIFSGMTQRKLANKLKVKQQQIQRWEQSDYMSASLKTFVKVANILEVDFRGYIHF